VKNVLQLPILILTLLFGCLAGASADTTNVINFGQILGGSILTPLQANYYTFTGTSNDVITVALLRTNGTGATYLYLYDPLGNLVFEGEGTGYASLAYIAGARLTKTGSYTFVVIESGLTLSYDYQLSLTKVAGGVNLREAGDGAEAIVPGQITSGHISPADMDTYTFTGTSNDVITVTLLRTNGTGDTFLYLYDPLGDAVFSGAGTGNAGVAYFAGVRLTKTGSYTFVVVAGGLDLSYDYNLCTIKNPGPNFPEPGEGVEVIAPEDMRAARITPGDLDAYLFHAIAYDTITLNLTKTGGAGNLFVELLAPDGIVIATASGASSARIKAPCVPQTGSYQIAIFDSGLSQAFDYELTLSQNPVVPSSSGTNQYLAIMQCSGEVIVRWETNSAGFILESIPVVGGTNWSPVLTAPQIIADHFYHFAGLVTNGSKFYRLKCLNCP
jgi:hypothetical protein